MASFHSHSTERLILRAVTKDDIDTIYSLNSDRRVWEHFPSLRHTRREQTEKQVMQAVSSWAKDGLNYWIAALPDGSFVGVGGCSLSGTVWNMYYRISPESQGKGFATEIARAGLDAANSVRPDVPITAFLLEHNLGSKAVAERIGLTQVWRGPDAGNPDAGAVRLVYTDRQLSSDTLDALVAK